MHYFLSLGQRHHHKSSSLQQEEEGGPSMYDVSRALDPPFFKALYDPFTLLLGNFPLCFLCSLSILPNIPNRGKHHIWRPPKEKRKKCSANFSPSPFPMRFKTCLIHRRSTHEPRRPPLSTPQGKIINLITAPRGGNYSKIDILNNSKWLCQSRTRMSKCRSAYKTYTCIIELSN